MHLGGRAEVRRYDDRYSLQTAETLPFYWYRAVDQVFLSALVDTALDGRGCAHTAWDAHEVGCPRSSWFLHTSHPRPLIYGDCELKLKGILRNLCLSIFLDIHRVVFPSLALHYRQLETTTPWWRHFSSPFFRSRHISYRWLWCVVSHSLNTSVLTER